MISCSCPHCRAHYDLEADLQFRKVRCAECQGAFLAPADGSVNVTGEPAPERGPTTPRAAREASFMRRAAVILLTVLALGGGGHFLQRKLSAHFSAAAPAPAEAPDVPLSPDPAFAQAAPTERAGDYPAALERAKATGNDILVLQRGSDWNLLGEKIYQEVWQKDAFVESLGKGFILVAVDRPEKLGAPALLTKENGGDGMAAFTAYQKDLAALPESQITALQAESGSVYEPRKDGAWLVKADPAKNPAQDTLTVTIKPVVGSQILRLDFPPDESLPNKCAGRASNGNCVINEVKVLAGDKLLPLAAAWSDYAEPAMAPDLAIDGKDDVPNKAWNAGTTTQKARTLLLALKEPLPDAGEIKVRLVCRSIWPQHIPGCLRLATVKQPEMAAAFIRFGEAATLAKKNAAFDWQANWNVPRLALLDKAGRAVAAENKPRPPLRASTWARIARDLRAKRLHRDDLWARAEKATGPDKAELLRQGLNVMGNANWPGNGNCYKKVHDEMKAADPADKSGAIRWLGFGGDPKAGVPWAKPAWNEALDTKGGTVVLTDASYQEALARVDKELADPRNKILPAEYVQRMMVARYHIYKHWKGHEEERFKVQKEIAALDRSTFWGIGGEGYLGEHGRSEMPYLSYGWKPAQVKPGLQTWKIADTAYFFAQAVPHKVTLTHRGGKDNLRIKRIALMDGDQPLAEAKPDKDCGPGVNASVVCELDCRRWQSSGKYTLLVEIEAAADKTDSTGSFNVEPVLVEGSATALDDAWWKRRKELMTKIQPILSTGHLAAKVGDPVTRKELAAWELLRRFGEAADKVAALPGGNALLNTLTNDPEWLEGMLTTDNGNWPQTLENLRLLHHHGSGFDHPVYRKMGTAMAMQAGTMNRWRLQDRFRHMQKIHQAGLLHAKFDGLTIREMNWAVLLSGTTEDYQFMVDEMQGTWPDYVGACWGIPYVDPNVYGYSVQGWGYVDPWVHHYGNGMGDRPYRIQRQVGGVCGTLSGYGSASARAHGVMATTVGQPGHCAYVVRVDDHWQTGNDVSGPETNGASVFEGTGFASMHRLYEAIHADQPRLRQASRLAWASHLLQESRTAIVHLLPGLTYQQFRLPGGKLADITKAALEKNGPAQGFDLPAVTPADNNNFGVVWEGRIEIGGAGQLQVSVAADDFARLVIGGQEIPTNKSWQDVKLAAGVYPIRLEYGQAAGALSLKVDWRSPVPYAPEWLAAAKQGLAAQPINYPLWLEVIKALEADPGVPPAVWQEMAQEAARAFAAWHEAGWALAHRCFAKVMPALPPEERVKVLLEAHQRLRQENAPNYFGYNFDAVLNTQAAYLGTAEMAVPWFEKLLAIHRSSDPAKSRVFGHVMGWGQNRFATDPKAAPLYIKAMENLFVAQGDKADPGQMAAQISGGITKASISGDKASYQLWNNMAGKLLPPLKPADVHLTPAQAAASPKPEPFPGELLSKDGMLKISSACQHDRPLSYRAVLDGSAPGWFDTNNEEKPWAQVELAGDAEVSGLWLLNRYEYASAHEEFRWIAPLKVSVSTDGKAWAEVARVEKADAVLRIDLQGKAARSRFVRIERVAPADGSRPGNGRFHLRNFLVYGKKLY